MMRRYSIWDELRRMQEEMDALFDRFFGYGGFWRRFEPRRLLAPPETTATELVPTEYRQPLADVYETDKRRKRLSKRTRGEGFTGRRGPTLASIGLYHSQRELILVRYRPHTRTVC